MVSFGDAVYFLYILKNIFRDSSAVTFYGFERFSRKFLQVSAVPGNASMVLRVSIEISDIKKLPPFQWQLSFLLFREHKHAPCAFTHSRVCAKQKRRLPSYKVIGEKDCCYCQQVP